MVSLVCARCGETVRVVGMWLNDDAPWTAELHLRSTHAHIALPEPAAAGELLRHFNVTRKD